MDEEQSESSTPYIVTRELRSSYAVNLIMPHSIRGISEKPDYIAIQIDYEDQVEVFSDERISVEGCSDVYLKLYLTNVTRDAYISNSLRCIYANVVVEEVWKNKECVRPLIYMYIGISIPTNISNIVLDGTGYIKRGSIQLGIPLLDRILCVAGSQTPSTLTSPFSVRVISRQQLTGETIIVTYDIEMPSEEMQVPVMIVTPDTEMVMPELPIFHMRWVDHDSDTKAKNRSPPDT